MAQRYLASKRELDETVAQLEGQLGTVCSQTLD